MNVKRTLASLTLTGLLPLLMPVSAHAVATTEVVTPDNQRGWSSSAPLADTRTNGKVSFVTDDSTPLGVGALRLQTTDTTSQFLDKAQYFHAANVTLTDVHELSFWTKQNSASFSAGDPSYQLPVCLFGVSDTGCLPNQTGGPSFATFVYEPYVDQGNAAVVNGKWQQWNVSAGKLWSTKTVGGVIASQGTYTYSLQYLQTAFPAAVVVGFGVNVGSNNPNYDVEVDGVTFNDTTYDFEPYVTPTDKDQCKKDGYKLYRDEAGGSFKNQGQCVSYVARMQAALLSNNPTY